MYFTTALLASMVWLLESVKDSTGEAIWTRFATSPNYHDKKIFPSPEGISFEPVHIAKDTSSISATIFCTQLCARNPSCKAANFNEMNDSYVCELLGDNLCNNTSKKALVSSDGGLIWDKVSPGSNHSCFETRFPISTNVSCDSLRPGCLGTWPNCFNCTKTCIDWQKRGSCPGNSLCTLWPDGDSQYSAPILTYCSTSSTFLIRRKIDLTLKSLTMDLRMSFADINRLYRLGVYNTLRFFFKHTSTNDSSSDYANSYIYTNGTLAHMTYQGSVTAVNGMAPPGDIFHLNGTSMEAKPFITVTDDVYGCGSFWLLDTSNATYCPGGEIKMLGTAQSSNGAANLSTLFRFPGAPPSETFIVASILLVVA